MYRSLASHDLRRTFAKLVNKGKSGLEEIQLSLAHASIPKQVSQLRNQGVSWRGIAEALRIGTAIAMRPLRSIRWNLSQYSRCLSPAPPSADPLFCPAPMMVLGSLSVW